MDGNTGEEEWVPALPVNAVDATGAGDNYTAAFLAGTLRGWPLRQRMAFGNLCAGLAVQQVGGSLAALLAATAMKLLEPWPLKFVIDRVVPSAAGESASAATLAPTTPAPISVPIGWPVRWSFPWWPRHSLSSTMLSSLSDVLSVGILPILIMSVNRSPTASPVSHSMQVPPLPMVY